MEKFELGHGGLKYSSDYTKVISYLCRVFLSWIDREEIFFSLSLSLFSFFLFFAYKRYDISKGDIDTMVFDFFFFFFFNRVYRACEREERKLGIELVDR